MQHGELSERVCLLYSFLRRLLFWTILCMQQALIWLVLCSGMSGVVDPLQSVEEQVLREDTSDTDKAHSPPLLPDQTSVVLSWTVEQVTHWLSQSLPIVPDRLQGSLIFTTSYSYML